MTGNEIMGAFFKAADAVTLVNVFTMVAFYASVLTSKHGPPKDSFSRNLCLGIVVWACGTCVYLGNFAWVYWRHEADPMFSLAAPIVRVTYLLLVTLGSSILITTYLARLIQRSWWGVLGLWLLGWSVMVAILTILDGPGLLLAVGMIGLGMAWRLSTWVGGFSTLTARVRGLARRGATTPAPAAPIAPVPPVAIDEKE